MRLSLRTAVPAGALVIVVGYFVAMEIVVALRSDETRVKLVLEDVVRRTVERDPGAVLEYVDPGYRDGKGYTAAEVRRAVRFLLMRAKSATARIEPLSIAVDGDTATVRARASGEVQLPNQTFSLQTAGFRGEVFDLELKRFESYFRLVSVREAQHDEEAPQ